MIQLELTHQEEIHITEAVEKRLVALDHEIAHTDSIDFKHMLKCRRETVRRFLLKAPNVPTVAVAVAA